MKVFISWSGEKAKIVAIAMKAFLQDVNQRMIIWFSASDISAGERWNLQLATELEHTDYGIICVTQESIRSPWILFEAGALAKSVTGGRVCPYLIDMRAEQLPSPLSQFQAKSATKQETWELLQAINFIMSEEALAEVRLSRYFDKFWPDLEEAISRVNKELRTLPTELENELLKTLPPIFYKVEQIEMFAYYAGIPVWEINLNQAAIYVWRELIRVAVAHKQLEELLDRMKDDYPGNSDITALREKVRVWMRS
jgi:hypothetical protein